MMVHACNSRFRRLGQEDCCNFGAKLANYNQPGLQSAIPGGGGEQEAESMKYNESHR
jgi:hypothetical protein